MVMGGQGRLPQGCAGGHPVRWPQRVCPKTVRRRDRISKRRTDRADRCGSAINLDRQILVSSFDLPSFFGHF